MKHLDYTVPSRGIFKMLAEANGRKKHKIGISLLYIYIIFATKIFRVDYFTILKQLVLL